MELRLPSEYQEVEYIENTGTQYIITDLLFPKDLENPKIEWGFMQIAVPSGDNMVFGYWSNGSIYYEVYNSTTLSYASIGKNHYDRISNSNLTKDMFIAGVMTKETMYLNEYSYATNAEDTIDQSVRPMAIFAWNSSSGRTYTNKGARIYYLRFFDGNTKMADYVPCYHKSDGEIGMYDTVTKTFYTNSGTDTFLKGADITRYIDNVSVLDTRRKILLNTPHIDTSVGDLVTFNTDLSAPLKSCKVSFLPVQEGEGDPSPDNVREIKGWNGVTATRSGKNLVEVSAETRDYLYSQTSYNHFTEDNNIIIITGLSNGGYRASCKPNTQYTYSCEPTLKKDGVYLRVWEEIGEEINLIINQNVNSTKGAVATFTTGSDVYSLIVGFYIYSTAAQTGLTISDFQLELGDTRTAYEPYQSTTISVDWTDSVGTVYGGYIDLISGELVKEYECKRVDTNLGAINYSTSRIRYTVADAYPINSDNSYVNFSYTCNMFPKTKSSSISGVRFARNNEYTTAFVLFQGIDSFGIENTLEAWNDFTSSNDIYITYKLKDPIHYQLTPQQILTLKGINNVYSDTNGQMEIKYWKH